MDKKQVRKSRKIDMGHFLRDYYGVDNDKLISKLCVLSHRDLKEVAPLYGINLVRTKFDLVAVDQVLTGTIILVNDVFGNPAPYVNPNRTLVWSEFDTELDLSKVSEMIQEIEFDKKGRQKRLRKIIRLRKGE